MAGRRLAALLLAVCLLAAGYGLYLLGGPRQAHFVWTAGTSLKGERIGPYHLREEVGEATPKGNYEEYQYYATDDGAELAAGKGSRSIVRIQLNAPGGMTTKKGIAVGDAKEKVIKLYGSSFYNRTEQGMAIMGYVDHERRETLEFWLREERVAMLRLDDSTME
ncbi:hypothetical protein [Ectobacillus ponti]|uniref:Uncharacterized protein n=1 Tax=Ectobacillus ponti TaxID=2961894 RepID=A0AA41XAT4_9BACI|nr:hypothetical protein [Ectobacillus ponti]MCP8968626.1 hypothetical protein [Ectobacillus ponti]